MSEKKLTPAGVLEGESPLVLTATFKPIGSDRFQPAGFPEIGHVIYKAPRKDGTTENVCIVDSAASMANHLESVCMRGPHDFELVGDLNGMPYIRCVTGDFKNNTLPESSREVVVTSLTEGHRIASSYFIKGVMLEGDAKVMREGKNGQAKEECKLEHYLIEKFGIVPPGNKKPHPLAGEWWNVFKTIFELDPNSLVHGVLFLKWQIKIPRALTAHLEAFGAGRVDRSGVKFDRLGKTTSRQPIFAVDDVTAGSIRATFVLDMSLIRSFGRRKKDGDKETQLGLSENQKKFLVALALWKIKKLTEDSFRFRSDCHLRCTALESCCGQKVSIDVDIQGAIKEAGFSDQPITNVFWKREELYREGARDTNAAGTSEGDENGSPDEDDSGAEEG